MFRMILIASGCIFLTSCGTEKGGAGGEAKGAVTKAGFDKVKEGMTLKEAEDILGKGKTVTAAEIDKLTLPEGTKVPFMTIGPGAKLGDSGSTKTVAWMKWGDDKKFILLGLLDDKVQHRLSNGL